MPLDEIPELNKKYKDMTVAVYASQLKRYLPFTIEEIVKLGQNEIELSGYLWTNDVWEPHTQQDTLELQSITKAVELGVINYEDTALIVRRTPRRQWKEGLDHTVIKWDYVNGYINTTLSSLGVRKDVPMNGVFYSAVFNPSYFSLRESVDLVRSGKHLAAAFTNRYSISTIPELPHTYLFYYDTPVGLVDNDYSIILPYQNAAFEEELHLYGNCIKRNMHLHE